MREDAGLFGLEALGQLAQHPHPFLDVAALEPAHLAARLGREPVELVQVEDDDLGRFDRDGQVEVDQGLQGLARGVGVQRRVVAAARQEPLGDRDEGVGEHLLLAALEVVVEGRSGDVRGRPDVVHRHAVVAVLGQHLHGDVEDLAAPFRAGAAAVGEVREPIAGTLCIEVHRRKITRQLVLRYLSDGTSLSSAWISVASRASASAS
ncbi:hypothetical protein GCM10029992_10870 [Glycomyces albus]